ncbi:hypothetical protein Leryth_002333 [Lithospermum erythrorhizon]|nr:hypothetical protein Leryth_002333 [Lithospermum erythrorhizon]
MRTATQILNNHTDQVWAVAFGPPGRTDVRSCLLASVSRQEHSFFISILEFDNAILLMKKPHH